MRHAALVLVIVVMSIAGCGGGDKKPTNRPKTVPVTGTVTHKGSPVAGAKVSFVPVSSTDVGAIGLTKDDGTFELMTFEAGDGAIPTQFKVTVSKTVVEGGELSESSLNTSKAGETKYLIPQKYSNPNTSGLAVKVEDGKTNDFKFNVD